MSVDPYTVTLVVNTWHEQILSPLNNNKFIEFMYIANDLIQRSVNKRNKEGKSANYDIEFRRVLTDAVRYITEVDH